MRRRWSRGIAVILSLGLLGGLAIGASGALLPQPTEAAWTDQENTVTTATAGSVPTPTIVSCTPNGVLGLGGLLQSVTMVWKTTEAAPAAFRVGLVSGANGTPTSGNVSVTPTLVAGTTDTYTVTIPIGLLTGLLASLLGGTATLGVSGTAGTNWVSPGWARAELKVALLGLLAGSSCTPLPA